MDVLWESPNPLKPSEVRRKLEKHYAYTTVMTVLKRMTDKDILKRQPKGKVYFYCPKIDKVAFATECLDDLYSRLFHSYGQLAVTRFLASAQKSNINIKIK